MPLIMSSKDGANPSQAMPLARAPYETSYPGQSPMLPPSTRPEQYAAEIARQNTPKSMNLPSSPYYNPQIARRKKSIASIQSDLKSPPFPPPPPPPPQQYRSRTPSTRSHSVSSSRSDIESIKSSRTGSATPSLRDILGARPLEPVMPLHDSCQQELNKHEYTSGRFLSNERKHLDERFLEFNAEALKDEVQTCMGNRAVSNMALYLEGNSNRFFILTLEDGFEVMVKIPYRPKPRHYATASEVATMTFLRTQGLAVPQIYSWCSRAEATPIGAEFIIMEVVSGTTIEVKLPTMDKRSIESLTHHIVDIESYLMSLPFSASGSIYFREDVPRDWRRPLLRTDNQTNSDDLEAYCIGPTTNPAFWRGLSGELTEDHGPWDTPSQYMVSLGQNQLRALIESGQPCRNKFPFNAMFEDVTEPEIRTDLLKRYLSVAAHVLAGDSKSDTRRVPVLRHPARKVISFQSTDDNVTTTTTWITNWRHATILPLALTAGYPPLFHTASSAASTSTSKIPPPTNRPKLPHAFGDLDVAAQTRVLHQHRTHLLHHFYFTHAATSNPDHAHLLHDSPNRLLHRLHLAITQPWAGVKSTVPLQGALIRLSQNWQHFSPLVRRPQSMSFAKPDIRQQRDDEALLEDADELVKYIRKEIGLPIIYDTKISELDNIRENGAGASVWISHQHYEEAQRRNQELKMTWINEAGSDREKEQVRQGWLFDDDRASEEVIMTKNVATVQHRRQQSTDTSSVFSVEQEDGHSSDEANSRSSATIPTPPPVQPSQSAPLNSNMLPPPQPPQSAQPLPSATGTEFLLSPVAYCATKDTPNLYSPGLIEDQNPTKPKYAHAQAQLQVQPQPQTRPHPLRTHSQPHQAPTPVSAQTPSGLEASLPFRRYEQLAPRNSDTDSMVSGASTTLSMSSMNSMNSMNSAASARSITSYATTASTSVSSRMANKSYAGSTMTTAAAAAPAAPTTFI